MSQRASTRSDEFDAEDREWFWRAMESVEMDNYLLEKEQRASIAHHPPEAGRE